MDSWINSDTDNLYVCHNLPFLDLLEMAIGKYGNVLFGEFLTYRQVMGVYKYQNLTRNPFLRLKVSSDKVKCLIANFSFL